MFTRAARYMNKVLSYPGSLLAVMAMVAMVFTMVMVVADVFMRWLFNSPIRGTADLVGFAFSIMVWGSLAVAALKARHTALTFVLDRIPHLPRLVVELIISLVSGGMLGIVSWRLVMYGIDEWEKFSRSGVLDIPFTPFIYVGAFACAVAALAFLARIPETLGKIRKEK